MTSLLFLPGHMCDSDAWGPVADRLAPMGFDMIHAQLNQDADIDLMALRALGACDGPVIPIGFSMGAIAALAMQRAAPERVAALCLVGINVASDLPDRSVTRKVHQQAVREGRMIDVVRDAFIPAYFSRTFANAQDLKDLCIAMAMRIGPEAFIRQSEALRTRPDARTSLGTIGCPTLVIGAEEDQLCPPEWHRDTATAIAGSTLEIMPGGHMALLERPDDMAERIRRWLTSIMEQGFE